MTRKKLIIVLGFVSICILGFLVLEVEPQVTQGSVVEEQAVIIKFFAQMNSMESLHNLEDQIEERVNEIGEYDGNEVSEAGGTLYLYGSDAHKLYAAVKDILLASSLMKNAEVTLRFGSQKDGVTETQFRLGSH